MNSELDKIIEEYKQSEKIIDLHSHTVYSDGGLEPQELLILALKNKIGTFAITDHDMVDGIKNLYETSSDIINESGIRIINGVELSAKVDKGTMHILGYGIDINNKALNDRLNELRNNNFYAMISYLNDLRRNYGISFTIEEIRELFSVRGNIGRPHLARLMIDKGYVSSVNEAFKLYLNDVYDRQRQFNRGIYYEECISLIKNAGGLAILAHPYQLKQNDEDTLKTIKRLIECGLDGIEVYHSNHTEDMRRKYLEIVKDLNLIYSGGSDYHGVNIKPDIELGYGINDNLHIKKLTLLDKL